MKNQNMENEDFLRVEYTGKIKETGETFDTTDVKVAKEENIYRPKTVYGPVPIILGAGMILAGLEDEIKKMKVGEKKGIEITPERGFGKRDARLIKTFTEAQFKKHDITPVPGLIVELNNIHGKILSVSGGRVKVDFNHPLSGKNLIYQIELKEKIESPEEKIKAILQYYTALEAEKINVEIKNKEAVVSFAKKTDVTIGTKEKIIDMIKKYLKDIEKVKFEDVFKIEPDVKKEKATAEAESVKNQLA